MTGSAFKWWTLYLGAVAVFNKQRGEFEGGEGSGFTRVGGWRIYVFAHFICVLSIKPHLDHEIQVPLPGHLKVEPKWSPMEPKWSPHGVKIEPKRHKMEHYAAQGLYYAAHGSLCFTGAALSGLVWSGLVYSGLL